MLGHVSGDGNADLVTYEDPGGNTTKYLVTLTSDEPASRIGTSTTPTQGDATVNLYNCVPEHTTTTADYRPLYYWTINLTTTGQVESSGPEEDSATVLATARPPAPNTSACNSPINISTKSQRSTPKGNNCNGRNDPQQTACVRRIDTFRGQSGGATVDIVVPG
jgi:hypothetical protein